MPWALSVGRHALASTLFALLAVSLAQSPVGALEPAGGSTPRLMAPMDTVAQSGVGDLVVGLYGVGAVLVVALIWLLAGATRSRRGLQLARLTPRVSGDRGRQLPPLDEETLDVIYLDDRGPTGHLSAYIAAAREVSPRRDDDSLHAVEDNEVTDVCAGSGLRR